MEHYGTLFDEAFLPQGIALHASLHRHAQPFTLWVLCLDRTTKTALDSLQLSDVQTLALADCETPELRIARGNRSYGEYCWTLASHLFSFVFDRDPTVRRLTYVDADVYFFGSPTSFIRELEESAKPVLITEHAYAPSVAHYAKTAGRFCVQFITFERRPEALALLESWQRQTLESCSSARDSAVFGDQQYLDAWPARYPHLVHILDHRFRTLAPWNADHALKCGDPDSVVFYHFHSFRTISQRWAQWCVGYTLTNPVALRLYSAYQAEILAAFDDLRRSGSRPAFRPFRPGIGGWLRLARSWVRGQLHLRRLPLGREA
jgi:hypothetical protein